MEVTADIAEAIGCDAAKTILKVGNADRSERESLR